MHRLPALLRRPALAAALLLCSLLAAALPAAAGADSILYVKAGDVWLSTPDGSRQFQVTAGGGYSYASQSDSGEVIVAARDRKLVVLTRTGELVRELPTVIGNSSWFGPFDPQVSPDGAHVAYQYYTGESKLSSTGVAYANTDGSYGGYDLHTGWGYPAWVDNTTLLHSDPPNGLSQDTILRRLTDPNTTGEQWFSHDEFPQLRDGDLRGNRMVFVAGPNAERMPVYRFDGALGSESIFICYAFSGPNGKFESPVFSPDGASLAWNEDDGIWVGPAGDFSAECQNPSAPPALTIPGGRYPDWGPADVPPPRAEGGGGGDKTPNHGAKARLKPATTKLGKALKQGFVVTVQQGGSGKVTLKAKVAAGVAKRAGLGRKATVVASGSAALKNGGAKVRLRFTAKASKRLGKLGKVPLTVSGKGATTKLTLKR